MTLDTNQVSIQLPATQGFFGPNIATYTTQVRALQLRAVLGHDPRNLKSLPQSTRALYEKLQRGTPTKDRNESIIGYLEDRFGGTRPRMIGAFPAISIGITSPMRFDPISGGSGIGTLHIDNEAERVLLDGLGRVGGCLNLADKSDAGMALVKNHLVLPVTFYVPYPDSSETLTVDDLGQLFSDFNFRVTPVPAHVAIALDRTDPYIKLANELEKEGFIKDYGGMERKAASRGKKSSCLVVQGVLLRTVRGACGGRALQEGNLSAVENPVLTEATFERELQSITGFFTEIANRMGRERWTAHDSLHLTAPGWQALGVIHHDMNHSDLNLAVDERTHIFNVISAIDWSRSNREWADQAGIGQWEIPKNGTQEQVIIRGSGRNNTQAIINFLRKRTGLQPKIDAKKQKAAA